jgi:hypothetical protein
MHYRLVGDAFDALEGRGDSIWASGGLSYPQIRSRNANFWRDGSLDYKRLEDELLGTNVSDRHSNAVTGGFRGNLLLAGGKRMLDYTVALTGGELSRGQNQTDLLLDQLRRCTWAVRVRCGSIRSRKPVVTRDRRCRSKPAGLPCVPRRSGARLDVVCAGDLGHADINKHTWDGWNANDPNARNSAIG